MKYTNKLNLPSSIEAAVKNDTYTRGSANISVTGLIGPARKRRLEINHADELTTDVADRIWSLYGQIVHAILERADLVDDQIIAERRLYIDRHGWKLSGQFDRVVLSSGTLQDYKFTSVYAVKDGVKPEYEAQGNIYRLMLRDHGYNINAIQVIGILRDWSKTRARVEGGGYPQHPVAVLDVPVWSYEQTEEYITARLKAHGLTQTELPECTDDERWASNEVFKVRKVGNKTAIKGHANFKTEQEAETAMLALQDEKPKDQFEVIFVPGEAKRCQDYCEAAPFCSQYQQNNPNKLGL